MEVPELQGQYTIIPFRTLEQYTDRKNRDNTPQTSWKRPKPTRSRSPQRLRTSCSWIAVVLSLWNSRLKYVHSILDNELYASKANLDFQGDFKATGIESNTPFTAIDLSEGEWYDYDDKAGEEVSIKDIKWEIRRA